MASGNKLCGENQQRLAIWRDNLKIGLDPSLRAAIEAIVREENCPLRLGGTPGVIIEIS